MLRLWAQSRGVDALGAVSGEVTGTTNAVVFHERTVVALVHTVTNARPLQVSRRRDRR
jgi:hypothetical protein